MPIFDPEPDYNLEEGEFYGKVVALMKRQRFNHPSQDAPQT